MNVHLPFLLGALRGPGSYESLPSVQSSLLPACRFSAGASSVGTTGDLPLSAQVNILSSAAAVGHCDQPVKPCQVEDLGLAERCQTDHPVGLC